MTLVFLLALLPMLAFKTPSQVSMPSTDPEWEVVVYGGTAGGVVAAVAAARLGRYQEERARGCELARPGRLPPDDARRDPAL